jgi:hypothetical protein
METITNSQYKIVIDKDMNCESPRTNVNLGTMVCFHRRYDLSDRKHGYTTEEIRYSEETGKLLGDEPMIFLPVYGYDHGGMSISTTPFSCPWDSGKMGIIYVKESKVKEEYKRKRITKALREKVLNNLRAEIEEMNKWLHNDTWCYQVYGTDGVLIESVGGFIGREYLDEHLKEYYSDPIETLMEVAKQATA